MSEAEPKKKGGKLPVVVILAAVLGAGGYFGMASRPSAPAKEPEPTLGKVVELEEFIVNLKDRQYFMRASVALHMDKYSKVKVGGEEGGKGADPTDLAIRDAVQRRLSSIYVDDLKRADFQDRLRWLIANDVNKVLGLLHEADGGESKPKKSEKNNEKDEEEVSEEPKAKAYTLASAPIEELENPNWDSDKGPVLKVYITALATQRE